MSLLVTLRAPACRGVPLPPAAGVAPLRSAWICIQETLVASAPAPESETAPPVELASPTAALPAATLVWRLALLVAPTCTAPLLTRSTLVRLACSRLPWPPAALVTAWGFPPDASALPWVAPMKLRARATPIDAWSATSPLVPPAATPTTLAVISLLSLASTLMLPVRGMGEPAVPLPPEVLPRPERLTPSTSARVSPRMVLKLWAPPPLKPPLAVSVSPTAAAMATAVASLLMLGWRVALTSKSPPRVRLARLSIWAVTSPLIVLLARETPMATERFALPCPP